MKKDTRYPPFYASNTYYSNIDETTIPVIAHRQSYQSATALKKNPGITLLYFLDDHGKIIVNTESYPVSQGLFICMGIYHFFQLIPDPEKGPMELIQMRMNYHTFLYMVANPYYNFRQLNISSRPLFSQPNSEMNKLALSSLEKLVTSSALQEEKNNKNRLLLGMKIMGIFQKFLDCSFFPKKEA